MPQFTLNDNALSANHPFYDLDTFARGYVEAMFFTNGDTGDEDEFKLNRLGVERLTKAAVVDIAKDCAAFQAECKEWLDIAINRDGYSEDRAGNDFWLSRQGHGVGFSDREALEEDGIGERLQDRARAFGEAYCETYRGWIYHR